MKQFFKRLQPGPAGMASHPLKVFTGRLSYLPQQLAL